MSNAVIQHHCHVTGRIRSAERVGGSHRHLGVVASSSLGKYTLEFADRKGQETEKRKQDAPLIIRITRVGQMPNSGKR